MIEGTIKIPVTVAMVRALALQADPGLVWPEWMMPNRWVYVARNLGKMETCKDCDGSRKVTLQSGRVMDCDCTDGKRWRPFWSVSDEPVELFVGVTTGKHTCKVEFSIGVTLSRIGIEDLFPTLEAAREAVKVRNGEAT